MLAALLISASAFSTTLAPIQLLNPTGSTSGQAIVSTGASTAPGWTSIVDSVIAGSGIALSGSTGNVTVSIPTNGVALTQLAQQSANTLLGNSTGSTANVTAVSVTGCNGAAQALQWTSGSGFGCNSNIATSGANANITSLTGLTGGIVGTATNNNASAGSVGEYVCAQVWNGGSPSGCATNSSTPVSLSTGVTTNVTSISLTAGDWDVSGQVAIVPAASTTVPNSFGGSSTTSATIDVSGTYWQFAPGGTAPAGANYTFAIPTRRISIASTTTIYLVANASFTVSTCTATGFIRARRIR